MSACLPKLGQHHCFNLSIPTAKNRATVYFFERKDQLSYARAQLSSTSAILDEYGETREELSFVPGL